MSLLQFFKPIDGLPDPIGVLTYLIPSKAIVQTNKKFKKPPARRRRRRSSRDRALITVLNFKLKLASTVHD